MMEDKRVLREQLAALLTGQNAHANFEQAMENFPVEYINNLVTDFEHTPWQILEHLRISQLDILEFVRNAKYVSPSWPDGYWPKNVKASATLWGNSIRQFRKDLDDVIDIVNDLDTDFFGPIPHAKEYTIFREVLLIADHNAYHIGQFIMMRKILGIWPPT